MMQGDVYHWVSKDVCEVRSVYKLGASLSEFEQHVGNLGQVWELDEVPDSEAICQAPSELKFFVYVSTFDKILIQVPFSPFQRRVLEACPNPVQTKPIGFS